MIIGRRKQQERLSEYARSKFPELIALYGRSCVGKTYLIDEFFHDEFTFKVTGYASEKKSDQLQNFHRALAAYGDDSNKTPKDWPEAFDRLAALIDSKKAQVLTIGEEEWEEGEEQYNVKRKALFFDELPFMNTQKSGFLAAFGSFWNTWASRRPEVFIIACGSAASWMVNSLIRDRGGLHNRVTHRMQLLPFTLFETEQYLRYRGIDWDRSEIALFYMAFGGIPFYLGQISASQKPHKRLMIVLCPRRLYAH